MVQAGKNSEYLLARSGSGEIVITGTQDAEKFTELVLQYARDRAPRSTCSLINVRTHYPVMLLSKETRHMLRESGH